MKIDAMEDGSLRLREVFNSVVFESEDGERLAVCMRDGGFEVGLVAEGTTPTRWLSIRKGRVEDPEIDKRTWPETIDKLKG